jgi:hypothetical protein
MPLVEVTCHAGIIRPINNRVNKLCNKLFQTPLAKWMVICYF